MKSISLLHKSLRIAFIVLISIIFTTSSAAPVGTIMDTFDIFRWSVDMTISQDNELYILDRYEGLFKADLESKIWKSLLNGKNENYEKMITSGANDLFVSLDFNDTILHSNDKGATWEKISLTSNHITKMCSDGEKRIWLIDVESNIYFSKNNGESWDTLTYFHKKGNYITDIIYDKEEKSLLIILATNFEKYDLFKSSDNGVSFSQMPTPANQIENYDNKAQTSNLNIHCIRDYYYAHQGKIISKTPKKEIRWEIVDEPQNNKTSVPDSLQGSIIGKCSKNDTTWYFTDKSYLYKIYDDEITVSKMCSEKKINIYCKEKDTIHCDMKYYNGIYYLAKGKSIYCKNGNSENWYRYLDSDNYIKYVWKDKNGVYMSDEYFNKYQINQEIDSIKPYINNLSNPKDKQIKNIIIRKGVIECEDGGRESKIIYIKKNNHFVVNKKYILGERNFLEDLPRRISKSSAEMLLYYTYNAMRNVIDTIPFDFTDKDLQKYRNEINDILDTYSRFNLDDSTWVGNDFSFIDYNDDDYYDNRLIAKDLRYLSSCLDTLKLTPNMLHTVLTESNSIYCTAGRYCIVELILCDGSIMKFENEDWIPNYLCCPWTLLYNGNPFLLKSLAVGRSIDKITDGKLLTGYNNKEYAIGRIIKFLLKINNQRRNK